MFQIKSMDAIKDGLTVEHLGGEKFRVTLAGANWASFTRDMNAGQLQKALADACAEFEKWRVEPGLGFTPPEQKKQHDEPNN